MIDSPYTPYLYQYIIGGFFFFLAIYVSYRKGAWSTANPVDRRTIRILIIGFVGYLCFHGLWIVLVS